MILISLDEQGEFEHQSSPQAKFIAGEIYDDRDDPKDLFNERHRIENYYRAVCAETGGSFPEDLHFRIREDGTNNGAAVSKVKDKIRKTLPEFLKKSTYNGAELLFSPVSGKSVKRIGKYYLFGMIKSSAGRQDLVGENVSLLVRDDAAANLYVHMAEELVTRLMFYNPRLENIKKVSLELATRKVVTDDAEKGTELKKLGYKKDVARSSGEEAHYYLTNTEVYRTAVEREMIRSGKKDIQIERLGSYSINYNKSEEDHYEMQSFLYMADSVCSVFGYALNGTTPEENIEEIQKRADKLAGERNNMIFAYDAFDECFQKAWEALEKQDYFETILNLYRGYHLKNQKMVPHYHKKWVPYLMEKLNKDMNSQAFARALYQFNDKIHSNQINQEEFLYIYQTFSGMDIVKEKKCPGAVMYQFYDCGISTYTHIGDSAKAKASFEQCRAYAKYAGVETWLNTRNRMVVFLTDSLAFKDSLAVAEENVAFYEEVTALRQLVFDDPEGQSLNYAKACSQLGQIYSYLRDDRAEESFLKALGMFTEGSADYYITLSFLLHHLAEKGDRAGYEKYAPLYFGGSETLEDQLKYILEESTKGRSAVISMKYALYVYVKAFYVFYADTADSRFMGKIMNLPDIIACYGEVSRREINNHPWEIIYKYLALAALKAGNSAKAAQFEQSLDSVLQVKSPILEIIALWGHGKICQARGQEAEKAGYIGQIMHILKEEMKIEVCGENDIAALLTYMYH